MVVKGIGSGSSTCRGSFQLGRSDGREIEGIVDGMTVSAAATASRDCSQIPPRDQLTKLMDIICLTVSKLIEGCAHGMFGVGN